MKHLKYGLLLSIKVLLTFHVFAQSTYFLKEKEGYASCFTYEIVDQNGKVKNLPDKYKDVTDCPSMIDIHGNILTFEKNGVRQYNLDTGEDRLLFSNYDDIDGCAGPAWSNDGSKLMFVVINQQMKHEYKALCRIIVLTLDDKGSVLQKQKFDRNVHFFCGSICSSIPGEDFYFKDDKTIAYREHTVEHENFTVKEIPLK